MKLPDLNEFLNLLNKNGDSSILQKMLFECDVDTSLHISRGTHSLRRVASQTYEVTTNGTVRAPKWSSDRVAGSIEILGIRRAKTVNGVSCIVTLGDAVDGRNR